MILGNKIDLSDSRVVTEEEANQFAESVGAQCFEVSTKEDINLQNSFR